MAFSSFVPLLIIFGLFFLRVPVALALLTAAAIYFAFINTLMPVESLISTLMATTESFSYLAIPLFTCAGVIFNYSGITKKILKLAETMVGHMTGGMAQVNVLVNMLLGGPSGSANADAAMTTKMIVPEMTRLGYDKGFSTVVTAASSCIAPIIPPGIILILYALVADVSITQIFFAGYLPGLLIYAAIAITVGIISKKRKYKPSRENRASWGEIGKQALDSSWALFLPFGILGGLRYGLFTPTEAGAVCVLYALLVGAFVYRELKWEHIPAILVESAQATAGVMFLICAAMAFSSYLTWEGIPSMVASSLTANITDPLLMLLVINLILLAVGAFFEGGSAMILMAPLFVPVIMGMGIDPVHFGIIMSINLTIAGFTPPVGTMMFITISIAKVKIGHYIRECWPFLIALLAVLFLVTYIPDIALILPRVLL
jgi:tripartite ATP-independent transporter DctM subunit